MTTHETHLAADLLDYLADLTYGGCNDWDFPESWSMEQRQQFAREFHDWNGDPENFNPSYLIMHNHQVAGFLAHKMKKQ